MKSKTINREKTNFLIRPLSFRKKEYLLGLLALVPALVLYIVFTCYPLFMSLIYSFTDWNGYSKNFNWVGLSNFITVLTEKSSLQSFGNTLYFAVLSLLIGLPLQLTLAVFLSTKFKGRRFAQTVLYIPALVSPVIVALTWTSLLQYTGLFNEFFRSIKADGLVIDWLGDVNVVKNALILVNLWQYTGYGMVVLMAGITAIPAEITEAATLDGAVGLVHFWRITLPLMMPAITVSLFLGITGALKVFELPLILTKGGPRNASTTVVLDIYNNAFGFERFGVASSMGLIFFVFIAVLTITQLVITRRREVRY